ncbi:cupin [Methylosinus sp. R-45379]|jgi:cupin 2 domain-containing protein|uniref:cupin domain-containing protein n=1 Tax=unclassified Methylosinus TaxID=2624500 RepID=UPI0004635D4A|nr:MULTISPECIES: cupin domain-containing protein [unclassified Methylosinus]OAI31646.1 cupin [Methylosinus sp. R-45379]TDX60597.1 cupin 2 domain-containing protein [Methylosinus sp. sav-2]
MRLENIFADLPEKAEQEQFLPLLAGSNMRVERIVSFGQASPPGFWHDQEEAEWVILLAGSAGLRFEGHDEVLTLAPGDYLEIAAHRRHRVEWTDETLPTVWLAVHFRAEGA